MIHILYRGLPLCLFSDKATPAEWPTGHQWVAMNDPDIERHVDCAGCKDQREKILLLRKK